MNENCFVFCLMNLPFFSVQCSASNISKQSHILVDMASFFYSASTSISWKIISVIKINFTVKFFLRFLQIFFMIFIVVRVSSAKTVCNNLLFCCRCSMHSFLVQNKKKNHKNIFEKNSKPVIKLLLCIVFHCKYTHMNVVFYSFVLFFFTLFLVDAHTQHIHTRT